MSGLLSTASRAVEAALAARWIRAMLRSGNSFADTRVLARDSFDLSQREIDATLISVVMHDFDAGAYDEILAIVERTYTAHVTLKAEAVR